MLDNLLFKEEENLELAHIFIFVLAISLIVLYITEFYIGFEVGMISTFLVTLAISYPMVKFMKREEKKEELAKRLKESNLILRHARELFIYLTIFLAVVFAFIIFASAFNVNSFDSQLNVISNINPGSLSGRALNVGHFQTILYNNLGVFFLTFLLSLVIAGGMVFILVWNASVLSVFLVATTENILHAHVTVINYLPHGLLEIAGYVLAGIAASLLAHQLDNFLFKKHYKEEIFNRVLLDVCILSIIGVAAIFLGSFVEIL